MSLRVGDEVVTITKWETRSHVPHLPVEGIVYRIRDMRFYSSGDIGLLLEGLVNPSAFYDNIGIMEPSFRAEYFRPVVKPKSLPAELTALLDPKNHKPIRMPSPKTKVRV